MSRVRCIYFVSQAFPHFLGQPSASGHVSLQEILQDNALLFIAAAQVLVYVPEHADVLRVKRFLRLQNCTFCTLTEFTGRASADGPT